MILKCVNIFYLYTCNKVYDNMSNKYKPIDIKMKKRKKRCNLSDADSSNQRKKQKKRRGWSDAQEALYIINFAEACTILSILEELRVEKSFTDSDIDSRVKN